MTLNGSGSFFERLSEFLLRVEQDCPYPSQSCLLPPKEEMLEDFP